MPGYLTKQQSIAIKGGDALLVRSLLDNLQFSDPDGDAERLGISSATWPLFGLIWPSGIELAARMAQRIVVAGERVLEIGCGLGLASLAAHRRGTDITASDWHPLAGGFLRHNVALNALAPLKYRHGAWASDMALPAGAAFPAIAAVAGRFDLVIGSDLLYEPDASGLLAGFIGRHANKVAEVWIVDPDRSNRPAFNRHMTDLGFALREERLDHALTASAPAYKGRMLIYRRGQSGMGSAAAETLLN